MTMLMTPAMAMKLLDADELKRQVVAAHVHHLAQQITEGKWRDHEDTIKILGNGTVRNGLHRLWAVVEANIAVKMKVEWL